MLPEILQNISLLAIAGLALHPLLTQPAIDRDPTKRALVLGIVLGLAAFLVSRLPIFVDDGAVIDGRAGPVLFAGYVGGPIAAAVAAALGAMARFSLGGPFVLSGVVIYAAYGALGLAYAWLQQRRGIVPEVTVKNATVLAGLGCLGAANMYWLISPAELAANWLRADLIWIVLANVVSVAVMALVLGFVTDTLAHRRAAETTAERLDLATRSAGIGIWDLDLVSGETTWNAEQIRLYGMAPDGFDGTFEGWKRTLHPEDRERAVAAVQAAIENDAPFDTEFRIVTPAGEERHMKADAIVIRDAVGRAVRMVGANFDISRLREVERTAREGRRRLEALANTIPGAMFRYAIDGQGAEQMEYMSPGCVDIWEVTAEEVSGDPSPLWDQVHGEDRTGLAVSIQKSAETLTPWFHEWRIKTPSGAEKWLQGHGWPRRMADGGTEWSSLILDITDQTETKRQLAESREMFFEAQKLEAVGKLTGGVAHDFNNLVAVIMGNLELLERRVDDADRELMDDALEACRRAATLTQQLLAFGRRATLRPEVLNMNDVLASSERLLRRTLPESIRLETVQGGGLWPVELDQGLLENALLNLALNARDAMPAGGRLTIETANVRLDADYIDSRAEDVAPGRYVMVAVSDTGTGMPPEIAESAFEPFFTTKGVGEGSGMGLAMVHGFVKQSRGIVRLYTEPGTGTTVKLYFPIHQGDAAAEPAPEADAADHSGTGHVLLAEDEDKVRAVIERQLTGLGYRVTACRDGTEALASLEADPSIDILVTDIVMPGPLQGPHLARECRARRPDLPVIFMSGYPQEAAIHGNGLKPDDIQLTKPVRLRDLGHAVHMALGRLAGSA